MEQANDQVMIQVAGYAAPGKLLASPIALLDPARRQYWVLSAEGPMECWRKPRNLADHDATNATTVFLPAGVSAMLIPPIRRETSSDGMDSAISDAMRKRMAALRLDSFHHPGGWVG